MGLYPDFSPKIVGEVAQALSWRKRWADPGAGLLVMLPWALLLACDVTDPAAPWMALLLLAGSVREGVRRGPQLRAARQLNGEWFYAAWRSGALMAFLAGTALAFSRQAPMLGASSPAWLWGVAWEMLVAGLRVLVCGTACGVIPLLGCVWLAGFGWLSARWFGAPASSTAGEEERTGS